MQTQYVFNVKTRTKDKFPFYISQSKSPVKIHIAEHMQFSGEKK